MYENLLNAVENLTRPKVLIAGDFMLDIYIYGDALRISPEAPVPVLRVRVEKTEYSCGGAGAVAADLAELGAEPVCLGIIGSDDNGIILTKKLKEIGSDITGLIKVSDRPTISKQRLIGLAQHRHQQQLFRMDEESTEPLTDEQNINIFECYKKMLPQIDIVCLQDHNKGFLNKKLCGEMIRAASVAGKKVIVDPCLASDYSKYIGATVITPNREESSIAVGFDLQNENDFSAAAEELQKKLGLEAVIITLDKVGSYLKRGNTGRIIPTHPRDVYDVTGAGDMVLSTLSVTLAAGCDYETAATLANIAGGIEVGKFGNKTVSIEEIIDEIVTQKRTDSGKVRPCDFLEDELQWHRRKQQPIVFTNGCFDVIHSGHIEFLKFCKSQGDILVIGLNSDKSVKTIKGPSRPINNQHDRAAVLAAMEMVDYITIFDESDPLNLIMRVKPDILVKGQDWEQKGVIGREFVESCGGKVVLAKIVEGKSSTATIEKIKSLEE
ncbi:D-glycero-beta-D-manno-heptose 1-phosphate adenylyltransferase [Planctomycetota bacterium]